MKNRLSAAILFFIILLSNSTMACNEFEVEGRLSSANSKIYLTANRGTESEIKFELINFTQKKFVKLRNINYRLKLKIDKSCESEHSCKSKFISILDEYKDLDYEPKSFSLFKLYKMIEECKD